MGSEVAGAAGALPDPETELTPDPPAGTGGEGIGGAAGAAGAGNAGGAAGAPAAVCGDGYCESTTESCATCASDCPCGGGGMSGSGGTPGSGGTSGGGGASGSGGAPSGGGSSGGSSTPAQSAMTRAKSGVGFSYWWGHGRFLDEGPNASNKGSCSGSCPSCSHSGSYGGDCSGFAAKVWQVPSSNTDMSDDSHPYSTADFDEDTSQWKTVPQGTLKQADAMVYRSGGAGHIFIYDHGDAWGSMYAYECKGCSAGCTAGFRTASSAYHAIRRTGY